MSKPRERAPLAELKDALAGLRHYVSDPFGVFVAEAARALGLVVSDPPPPDEAEPDVRRALVAYERAVLEAEPFRDVLGAVYMEHTSRSKAQGMGQFFTPWELSVLAARMTLADWRPEPKADGSLWSLSEPACGSGGMLLAAFSYLVEEHGPAALHVWRAVAVDKDPGLARTCAVQVYANLAARCWGIGEMVVLCGDTLRMDGFTTVAHTKIRPEMVSLGRVLSILRELSEEPAGDAEPAAVPHRKAEQTDLFGGMAA